ncbi:MAG: undecaprenyl-diphosphate phosphatase [Clostridia bacterium]|nr:undecaprenyl-diphosphate phosphatase [Clostridia bacterium]MBR5751547.1 undecaprenyl-diphosphate phosphatase [Clostridia bacterium]
MEGLTYLKSILLGILQGLTEFLPVSSSGHIMLLSEIFGIEMEQGVLGAFTVMLHLGTLLAVCIFYIKRIFKMLAHPVKGEIKWLIVATLPTVIFTLALKWLGWDDLLEACKRTLLPYGFLFTALILLLADGISSSRRAARTDHKDVGFKDALCMGLMQCVGTFTGVSRSGSTITGGVASGLKRRSAVDFSFMMSIPAILGGALLEGMDIYRSGELAQAFEGSAPMILAGIAAAFVAGIAAIKLMLLVIKKSGFKWFSLYLGLLGLLVIANDVFGIW